MLSRAEAEFLRGEKRAKPNQLRYLRHCVKRKISVFKENDLPAILGNDWARHLFQAAIGNNSTSAIDFNSTPGYEQIIVPDDLHSALKGQAPTRKTSMARLIRSILAWPVEPDARVRNAASRGSLDGGLSYEDPRSIDTEVSWLDQRQGFIEYSKRYNPLTAKTMISYLDRYVKVVRSPTDVIRVFNGLSAGQQHYLNRALRALFNYAEIMGSSKDWLDPMRKAIPKDKIGIDLRIPSEDEVRIGLSKIRGLLPKYKALWRVCLDSGIRLIEAIHLINSFDPQRLQAVNGFYRYQTEDPYVGPVIGGLVFDMGDGFGNSIIGTKRKHHRRTERKGG